MSQIIERLVNVLKIVTFKDLIILKSYGVATTSPIIPRPTSRNTVSDLPITLELSQRPHHFNLASTCRLRVEALPFVPAEKDIKEMKFEKLLAWITAGTAQNLAMIRTLNVKLRSDCFEALEESPKLSKDFCKFARKESLYLWADMENNSDQLLRELSEILLHGRTQNLATPSILSQALMTG